MAKVTRESRPRRHLLPGPHAMNLQLKRATREKAPASPPEVNLPTGVPNPTVMAKVTREDQRPPPPKDLRDRRLPAQLGKGALPL